MDPSLRTVLTLNADSPSLPMLRWAARTGVYLCHLNFSDSAGVEYRILDASPVMLASRDGEVGALQEVAFYGWLERL